SAMTLLLLCTRTAAHRDLHSFPTRRSSDLGVAGGLIQPDAAGCEGGVELAGAKSHAHVAAAVGFVQSDSAKAVLVEELRYCFIRSEEHTSELQSRENLVCRLLLEKKK